jgi:hypothetical protein
MNIFIKEKIIYIMDRKYKYNSKAMGLEVDWLK